MDELKLMNHWGVVKKLSLTDAEFDSWLASLGLAYRERHCDKCGSEMSLTSEETESGEVRKKFRCKAKACRKKIGYRSGTFFEDSKLCAKDIFHLSYFWSLDCSITYEQIAHELRRDDGSTVASHTIVDWMSFFRDICSQYFINNPAWGGESSRD